MRICSAISRSRSRSPQVTKMSGFGRRLIAALCIFSLSAPAYATTTYRVDKGIVEEVKLAIQESKKQLERYVINSLDDLETIKSLKDLASDYDDLLSIGDDLRKFLSEANSKEFKDGISPESLLASIAGEVEESEGIESGRIDGGTLSGKSGELSDIAKKEGYATALFTAVSRASEISEMRAEELTGEGTGVSTSSSKGRLADIAGVLRSGDKEQVLTADGTIYITDKASGATVRRTPVNTGSAVRSYKIEIISGEQAKREISAKGRLTESKAAVDAGTSNAVEYTVAKAAARAKLDSAFPAQNPSLIGTSVSLASSGGYNTLGQLAITAAAADASKVSMAGAGAEIQEKYFNTESEVGTRRVAEDINAEVEAQTESLSAGAEDGAEIMAARALGVIVRQQAAMISMTKQLALQQMDIVELAGLTANVASMKASNKMIETLINRISAVQSLPAEYFLEKSRERAQ